MKLNQTADKPYLPFSSKAETLRALSLRALKILLLCLVSGCSDVTIDLGNNKAVQHSPRPARTPCVDYNPQRNAYFGDLHVHTAYSADAWNWGLRLTPDDAYRYAFGESVELPGSIDADAPASRSTRINKPLDFAAVTDHAEFLAETRLCTLKGSPAYDTADCAQYRATVGRSLKFGVQIFNPLPWRDADICDESGAGCQRALGDVWNDIMQAAERWNDTSENCKRTTFIGYEYSSYRLGSNLHRNVIFKNNIVPLLPISYLEATREWDLWAQLRDDCLDSGTGCDVMAIPHNSNISNGRMFAVDYPGATSTQAQAERARLRMRLEPLVEIMQHKGDSECRNGIGNILGDTDELCNFEKFENFALGNLPVDFGTCYEGPFADSLPHLGPDCIAGLSYVRYALIEGLLEQQRLGTNPFKFGISASTDTHNALAGAVVESDFVGHLGVGDATAEQRTSMSSEVAGNSNNSPGGLIGIWAAENSREALFDSMRRKEVFGTSGPRIKPRFFASWDYDAALCKDPLLISKAYALGVPMGGDLVDRPPAGVPIFLASALADTETGNAPATPLQRLQIIKGWIDDAGQRRQKVFDIAGNAASAASVDLDNCKLKGVGYSQLCTVWQDPEFDANLAAMYYLRVVENPSCRYSAKQCASFSADQRPPDCQLPEVKQSIQERAWSSPIWYSPQ